MRYFVPAAFVAVWVGVAIWWAVAAPCSSMGWVPASDVPARCLGVGR